MTDLLPPLEIGDLVQFYAVGPFVMATNRYPSNGIVVGVRSEPVGQQNAYTVIWGGGAKTSTEWRCYLRKLS